MGLARGDQGPDPDIILLSTISLIPFSNSNLAFGGTEPP